MAAQILRQTVQFLHITVFQERLEIVSAVRCSPLQHLLMQIVHFHESNSGGIVYTAHDRGVVTWLAASAMIADSLRRLERSPVPDILHLIAGDNPADDCIQPVVIGGNQSSSAIVQLQCRINQCIGNSILSKLRANGTHNHFLWFSPATMNPPIITLSPVCTKLRVLMLPRIELVSGLRSYTSTRATPVVLFTPRTIAV